jgi:hypothetical protein
MRKFIGAISISLALLWVSRAPAQSGLYRIESGTYTECCGFASIPQRQTLPYQRQTFVRLDIDEQRNGATMSFLGEDRQTVFSTVSCPANGRIYFSFDHGVVLSDDIVFHVDPGPGGAYWNYTVSNSPTRLRIDGELRSQQGFCVDVPTRFSHTNVVAVFIPPPRLTFMGYARDRGARLMVQGQAGHTNLIEASSDLRTWTAVSTNVMDYSLCPICPFAIFDDTASANVPHRFYRAFELP